MTVQIVAVCLTSVSVCYGLEYSLSRIQSYTYIDEEATPVLCLIEAARKLVFLCSRLL
jgi:hypothetical protein